MTAEELGTAIRSFRSRECPACGNDKPRIGEPFCAECSDRLPEELRHRVHDHKTYMESFGPAFKHLRQLAGSFDTGPDGSEV